MADKTTTPPQPDKQPPNDSPSEAQDGTQDNTQDKKNGRIMLWVGLGIGGIVAVFILLLIFALALALSGNPDDVANWVGIIRDLFIILLAMEGIVMGTALIVLVIQVAALLNVLQNEVQPIVDNANETVTTVKGTAQFMSQNVVEPVIKTSALLAGIGGVLREVIGIRRSLKRASDPTGEKKA
ncbi:MAG: hypothetical protein JXA10_06260 [Anaerolineae bacterium]|nr:hypothetical protein [Anaerolineae bacterium]